MANIPKPHYFYKSHGETGLDLVRPVLGSFNMVVSKESHIFPRHQHLNYQLIFAERGLYQCLLNGASLTLKPRDILLVKRGDWHEDICASNIRYLAVQFDLAGNERLRAGDILFDKYVCPEQQVVRGPNNKMWQILTQMRGESRSEDQNVAHIENALLLVLFWLIVRALPAEALSPIFLQQSAAGAFGEQLRRMFDRHLTESLSAAQMAAKLGVSESTLTKRCREVIGRPPVKAFMHYKTEYAARVLRQSEVPIKEISHQLGFQNQYHFSRVFRRYFGVPPSNFREPGK